LSPGVKYKYTIKAPGFDSLSDGFTIGKKTDLYQYYSKDYTLKLIPIPVAAAPEEVKKAEEVVAAPVAAAVAKVEEKKAEAPVAVAAAVVEEKKEPVVAKVEEKKKEVKAVVEKFLPETIYFDYNSSAVAESEKGKLDKLALYLKNAPMIAVLLKGYTDNVGGDAFNKTLSLSRATSAADYLKQQGVPENQIQVKAFGLAKPQDTNKTDEGRSHNRRVQPELVKK
ncbi:MAG: OmpA family protein, partial [Cytophagales bacterium]|nr:OmpA family protein [Cytophagales bacterium]